VIWNPTVAAQIVKNEHRHAADESGTVQ